MATMLNVEFLSRLYEELVDVKDRLLRLEDIVDELARRVDALERALGEVRG